MYRYSINVSFKGKYLFATELLDCSEEAADCLFYIFKEKFQGYGITLYKHILPFKEIIQEIKVINL